MTTRRAYVVTRPGALTGAMDNADVSLRELEAASGVSRSTLSLIANTDRGVAHDKAARIAEALGVPVGDLFVHKDGAPLASA